MKQELWVFVKDSAKSSRLRFLGEDKLKGYQDPFLTALNTSGKTDSTEKAV